MTEEKLIKWKIDRYGNYNKQMKKNNYCIKYDNYCDDWNLFINGQYERTFETLQEGKLFAIFQAFNIDIKL